MKGYSLSIITFITCCICRYTSVKIKPELKKNILKFGHTIEAKEHILDHITYCRKIRPFVQYCRDQIYSFNHTAHNILKNEIGLILPQ